MTFPFSILYREFEEILSSSCESIFVLLQDRAHKCAIESSKCPSGPWIKDSDLHTKLSSLKGWAEVVSKSCTKLTVIVTKVPTADHVKSILQEMCGQVSAFVGSYM